MCKFDPFLTEMSVCHMTVAGYYPFEFLFQLMRHKFDSHIFRQDRILVILFSLLNVLVW